MNSEFSPFNYIQKSANFLSASLEFCNETGMISFPIVKMSSEQLSAVMDVFSIPSNFSSLFGSTEVKNFEWIADKSFSLANIGGVILWSRKIGLCEFAFLGKLSSCLGQAKDFGLIANVSLVTATRGLLACGCIAKVVSVSYILFSSDNKIERANARADLLTNGLNGAVHVFILINGFNPAMLSLAAATAALYQEWNRGAA